jgi:hypothetical protein
MILELRYFRIASAERCLGGAHEGLARVHRRWRLLVLETQHKAVVRHDTGGAWGAGDVTIIVNAIVTVTQHGNAGRWGRLDLTFMPGEGKTKLLKIKDSSDDRVSGFRAISVPCR